MNTYYILNLYGSLGLPWKILVSATKIFREPPMTPLQNENLTAETQRRQRFSAFSGKNWRLLPKKHFLRFVYSAVNGFLQ
ncbi:hypothetical protein GW781_08905 [bacterium]|nr:hypothetical protein [bacterium]NCT21259.1 hypothetical protein [bacterium]